MNYARRFSLRWAQWMSWCLCAVVILTSLAIAPISEAGISSPWLSRSAKLQGQSGDRKAKKVNPTSPDPAPPAGNLPNLNEARTRRPESPHLPPPVPSTLRSRRKALRGGRKIATLLPTKASSHVSNARSHHDRFSIPSLGTNTLLSAPPPIDAPTNLTVNVNAGMYIRLSWTA